MQRVEVRSVLWMKIHLVAIQMVQIGVVDKYLQEHRYRTWEGRNIMCPIDSLLMVLF